MRPAGHTAREKRRQHKQFGREQAIKYQKFYVQVLPDRFRYFKSCEAAVLLNDEFERVPVEVEEVVKVEEKEAEGGNGWFPWVLGGAALLGSILIASDRRNKEDEKK